MVPGGYGLVASLDARRGESYGKLVAKAGLEPLVLRDGAAAERALQDRGAPALLVTELSLPRADGFSLLGALRAIAGPTESPAVVVNGFAELHKAITGLRDRLGIAAVLGRGASDLAIDAAIRRALEHGGREAPPVRSPGLARPAPPPAQPLAVPPHLSKEVLVGIATEMRRVLNVPVATVVLLANNRVEVPVRLGVTAELPELLFFGREVADARELLVVPDVANHPLFSSGKPPLLRGYAAAPILLPRGDVAGILCVADDRPLSLGAEDLDRLEVFARRVAGELALATALSPVTTLPAEVAPDLAAVLAHFEVGTALVEGGRIVYANSALGDLVEISPHRLEGMERTTFVAALAELAVDPETARQRLGVPGGAYAGRAEVELARPGRRVLRWSARPLSARVFLELFADVTAEVDLTRERELFARADWLTGLSNRRGGEDAIAREVARARRLGSTLCFALFDVDGLGTVNELQGATAGDELLRDLSQVIRAAVRGSDLAVRWGADELMVVLPGVREAGARVFAERVRKLVETMGRATVSVGVSELAKFEEVDAAIARADARMFQAKRGGRNRIA